MNREANVRHKRMKIRLSIILAMLFAGCSSYPTKAPLRGVMQRHDPSSFTLKQGVNAYVRRTHLEGNTEVGIIKMQNGSSSKYWFRSHHLGDDIGGTWFQMSDGATSYMAGLFCCELWLPKEQFASLADMKTFIQKHHGTAP